MDDHPDIKPGDLDDLPIFPLPGVVLFPGAVLPLHIFEERYREMTRDALNGTELVAMVRLRENDALMTDLSAQPAVFQIAGVGRIEASRELDDGRFYLLLRGVARVAIREELDADRSYRRVRAELRPDIVGEPQLTAATERQLVTLCDQLADSVDEAADLRELVREAETAGGRADLVAAAIVRDPDERQRLLEMQDPGDRLERLLELVAEAMRDLGVERHLN